MRADPGLGDARPALLILALSVFLGVTTETLPVGLLPAMGRSLGTTESTTGLLVTLYAGLVAVLAVPLTLATARIPRKRLLLITIGCFVLSNVTSAIAPGFAVLAVARGVGGATHAVFFSVCIGYAARLVPPERTGRALALASAGISAGFVLGVPAATALGTAISWRGAFGALALLMAVALVLVAVHLPAVPAQGGTHEPRPGRRRGLVAAVGANALVYTGQYTLYTYVAVLLLGAGATATAVGPLLLVFGAVGLLGVWVAGPRIDGHLRRTAVLSHLLLVAGIVAAAVGFPALTAVAIAGAVWNGAFGPMASIFQTAAVHSRATTADLAGAWVVATSNVGIAGGAAIGGLVLQLSGIVDVAWVAVVPVLGAAAVVLLARGTFAQRA